MITRPLDLAAKLRPPPRSFDALFWVNVGVVVGFFALFGSRFVLAPVEHSKACHMPSDKALTVA